MLVSALLWLASETSEGSIQLMRIRIYDEYYYNQNYSKDRPQSDPNAFQVVLESPVHVKFKSILGSASMKSSTSVINLITILICSSLGMSFLERIKQALSDPKQLAMLAAGVTFLGFYAFYARKQLFPPPKEISHHTLNFSLQQLIKAKDPGNICKIVITESASSSLEFKRKLVTRLKQELINRGFNTLVNCAPLKLFHAGSEVFVGTLSQEDPDDEQQFMSYFENALKCELVIERTIIDIDQIKNKGKNTYLICDTNYLDLKVNNNEGLWDKFLATKQVAVHLSEIEEKQLRDNYDIVFHIQSTQSGLPADMLENYKQIIKMGDKKIDIKIEHAWRNFKHYYVIQEKPYIMFEENVEIALEKMFDKLQPFLGSNVAYVRRRVFAKEW